MQHFFRLCSIWMMVLLMPNLISACQPIQPGAARAATNIVIEVTADGLQVPAELPAGIVTVTYKNSTDAPASPSLGWLVAGRTVAEFEAALLADDFPAILAIAVPLGGPQLAPGASEAITYDLQAGEILVVNFPNEGPPQMATSIAKPSGPASVAPAAEIQAELADFNFILPDEIPAGGHLWQISNVGKQWHHLIVLKLNAGTTIDDVLAMALAAEEPAGPPPFTEVAYYGDMGSNTTAWVTLDIPAGEYYVVCFMPNTDEAAMTPHLAHGMVRTLRVR